MGTLSLIVDEEFEMDVNKLDSFHPAPFHWRQRSKGKHGWMNAVTDERLGRPFVRQSVSPRSDGRINGSLPFEISVPSDPRQPLNGHNGFLGSLASFIATSGLSKCHEFQIMNGENRPLVTDEPG